VPTLAIAGSLAAKRSVPVGAGTLPTHTVLFVGLLIGTVLLVGALTFVPALALADRRASAARRQVTVNSGNHYVYPRCSSPFVLRSGAGQGRADRRVPQAVAARPDAQPGDAGGLRRQHPDHAAVDPGARWPRRGAGRVHPAIALWLWFTLLFANFAEAVAEGRSKAQAAALRAQRKEIVAKKLYEPRRDAQVFLTPSSELGAGMIVLVEAGDFIPADGEVIEGVASVDESAITGESAPVIREAAVTSAR